MTDEELTSRTNAALARHGLSLAEHFVLCAVGYRINLPAPELALASWRQAQGDPRGNPLPEQHVAALARCIENGWLRALTDADFDATGRRRDDALGSLSDGDEYQYYRPGHVDFTGAGYALQQSVLEEIGLPTTS